ALKGYRPPSAQARQPPGPRRVAAPAVALRVICLMPQLRANRPTPVGAEYRPLDDPEQECAEERIDHNRDERGGIEAAARTLDGDGPDSRQTEEWRGPELAPVVQPLNDCALAIR